MAFEMRVHRRHYVQQRENDKPETRYTVRVRRGGRPVAGLQHERITSVDEEVMFWTEAFQIHGWFLEYVQNGNDDCREYTVTEEQLSRLLDDCNKVIAASKLVKGKVIKDYRWNEKSRTCTAVREDGEVIQDPRVAKRLLPIYGGGYFASNEYDADYLVVVVRTVDWLKRTLAAMRAGVSGDIIYSSHW